VCGICGVAAKGATVVTPALIERMRDTMTHRGPDDAGTVILSQGRVGFGHRRLSIIDLSAAGHQPMANEDETVWLVYNGEVYNHGDIRSGLLQRGHRFKSKTDSEALIHLYEEHGKGLVHSLRGMFAFALWDERRRTLLLARDRLGIKPLFYADTPGGFVFASEIKALFASGLVKPEMDPGHLPEYLNYGRVLSPNSLFRGVMKLEPGHILEYGPDGVVRLERYWDVFDGVDRGSMAGKSEEDLVTALADSLRQAIDLRLMSDVPVGVFLSAGVDSSTIAAMVAEQKQVPLKTFTVGFEGAHVHNEVAEARAIAGLLGAEQHDVTVGAADVMDFFPSYLQYMEEPGSNPIWMAVYFVSRLARDNGVIVALSGDGGDELFVGYDKWMKMLQMHRSGWRALQALPVPARRAIAAVAGPMSRSRVIAEVLRAAADGEELYQGGTAFKRDEIGLLCREEFVGSRDDRTAYAGIAALRAQFERTAPDPGDYADWMSYVSLKSGLLEDYLMRLDKMGMAASIEGRVPLLDHEFVRLAMSIPGERKYAGGQRKRLLKEVARRVLPAAIVDAPKRGFNAPVEAWITGEFSDMLADEVSSFGRRTGVFSESGIGRLQSYSRMEAGKAAGYWGLLSLALWHNHWIAST
jgi:asparagine synthase (glutamine-hydrolysing)